MKKIVITVILLIIFLFCSFNVIYASSGPDSDIVGTAKNWLKTGKIEQNRINPNWTGFNDLAGIMWGIGVFTVLIIGTILGIKYMFSSVEEKASIKESIKPFIIGTVIILGALGIWKLLVEFLDGLM